MLSAAALAAAGCAAVQPGVPPIDGTIWHVAQINGRATPLSDQYRISFERGQLGARFGCNHMGGPYRQVGQVIHAGQIASTLMGCPEPAGTSEQQAGAILARPMTMSGDERGRRLMLINDAGSIGLVRAN